MPVVPLFIKLFCTLLVFGNVLIKVLRYLEGSIVKTERLCQINLCGSSALKVPMTRWKSPEPFYKVLHIFGCHYGRGERGPVDLCSEPTEAAAET